MASQINASNSGFGGIVSTGDSSGVLELQTTGTTALTIDTSQNVGIGTTNPSYKLEIGTTSDSSISANIKTSTTGTGNLFFSDTNNGQGGITYNHTSDYMRFLVNDTERMRIDSSGNVLVGTTTRSNDEKVTINQSANAVGLSIRSNAGPALGNYESSDATHATYWTFGRDNAVTGNYVFAYGGTLRGSISLSTGTYTASSDSRLKKHITNITYGLNEVMAMRPVTYLMNEEADTAKKHLGFIAQEIKAVLDEAVDDLIDPETQFYMLDKGGLVPVLVKAIQEQQTIINDLKARIETLEAK